MVLPIRTSKERTSHKGIGAQPRDAIGGFVHKNGCIGTIGGVVAKVSSRECDDEPLSAAILCRFLFREILRAFLNHEDYDYVESKWFGIKFVVKKS
ncbi:11791_t:CDS:2 [Rhizophagus irregularis]|nr:11791_t:CDS:2 [Rhizophagus irregularis]